MRSIVNRRIDLLLAVAVAALFVLVERSGSADDWPQWRGPGRDAVSNETGLLQAWPEEGPRLAWTVEGLGTGYSSVVVGQGRLFTMGRHGSDVIVTALDLESTKPVWTRKIGETRKNPSSTPTWDKDRVYALAPDGDLACLKTSTGEIVWSRSFSRDFAGRMMSARGNGESPLIDGDRLICTPGGDDTFMVALNKFTGAIDWKTPAPKLGPAGKEGASFSSIVVSEAAGVRQYVQLVGRGLIGVAADDGRLLWNHNPIANDSANIPTPIAHRDYVFASNGYSAGSVLLKLVPDVDEQTRKAGVKKQVVYSLNASQLQNHHGGFVRVGDLLFTGHGNNNGLPTCIEFLTGKIRWKRRGPGVGSAAVIYVDGQLIFRYQDGLIALIEATEQGYRLNGSFEVPGSGGDSWSHPVVAHGRLYLREQDLLWVYDLRKDSQLPAGGTSASIVESHPSLIALTKMDVMIERYPYRNLVNRHQGTPDRARSIYHHVLDPGEREPASHAWIVTISDESLSPDGTLSEPLINALKGVPKPGILSFAGSALSDAGLRQLQPLDPIGLNLELCGRLTNQGIQQLAGCASLRILDLSGTGVTGEGLSALVRLPELRALDLELCDGIKDSECEVIGLMRHLRMLILKKSGFERPGITEQGLRFLAGMENLEVLNLYGNSLKDEGLVHLSPFGRLKELNLSLLDLNDAGIGHLTSLKSLEHLELLYSEGFAGPSLTDGVVPFLTQLNELKSLNLTGSGLGDRGLEQLRSLTKLKSLHLVRTKVSSDAIQSFREAVPGCVVIH